MGLHDISQYLERALIGGFKNLINYESISGRIQQGEGSTKSLLLREM